MPRHRNRVQCRAFTLVELLVVTLIMAVLMAIALPLYMSAVRDSEKKTCRHNMQTIANAVQAKRVYSGEPYGPIAPPVHEALRDLPIQPLCPAGGEYYVDLSTPPFTVHCTLPDHDDENSAGGPGYTPGADGT